jgi:hypothetical protein
MFHVYFKKTDLARNVFYIEFSKLRTEYVFICHDLHCCFITGFIPHVISPSA